MFTIKNRVRYAYLTCPDNQNSLRSSTFLGACKVPRANTHVRRQRGVTLLELMVGIAVGLLVVAVAMGALMVSRGISGTVSDASQIQQQAAYAMRVIGTQMRQAGSLRVNLNYDAAVVAEPYQAKVAIETDAPAVGSGNAFTPSTTPSIQGTVASMTVGYRRYTEQLYNKASEESQSRNCVGAPKDTSADQLVESLFTFNSSKNDLRCGGNGATSQPIVNNVANFQVRYLLQDNSSGGDSKISNVAASSLANTDWPRVQGVEVCLVLYGSEPIDLPSGSNYTDCDGSTQDMSTQTGDRARRMHMVFRNVYQLRSQGLI
ncbi:MAG: PilW family protein [Proteobacteria bacterium]|nr:PilW family protein [Pseudomonadota bacterium]